MSAGAVDLAEAPARLNLQDVYDRLQRAEDALADLAAAAIACLPIEEQHAAERALVIVAAMCERIMPPSTEEDPF